MAAPKTKAPAAAPADPVTPAPPGAPTPGPASAPGTAPGKKDAPRAIRALRLPTQRRRRVANSRALENPLREGLRLERVPDPAAFVLFGATGDLAHRKVVPALFQLWRTHLLPHEFQIVAVGRRPYTDEAFRDELKASLDNYSRVQPVDRETWDDLAERITYHRGDFSDPSMFQTLADRLDTLDEEQGTRGDRILYLATQPSAFAEIVAGLGRVALDHERHEG